MISRMGKFTNSKHIILKKLDQMGEGKERKFVVKPYQMRNNSKEVRLLIFKDEEARLLMKVQLFQKESYDAKQPEEDEEEEVGTKKVRSKGTSSFKAPYRENVNVSLMT